MNQLASFPYIVFALSLFVLSVAAGIGFLSKSKPQPHDEGERVDLGVILNATLALLGLIIGFSFSMAVTRYDQRKNYEEEEANAIGTEYLRVDLLPAADKPNLKGLLNRYLAQRVLYYLNSGEVRLKQVSVDTAQIEAQLWSSVRTSATLQPTPVVALAVSGMNDVMNSQGYTQAAWRNRIPVAAWMLLGAIAICSNLLIGYGMQAVKMRPLLLFVLPLIVSTSFFLIADIDSPRGGLIQVRPGNLLALSQSLRQSQ